jgi:Icc-related predicted phosphoesterase
MGIWQKVQNYLQIGKELYLDISKDKCNFINHHCNPNTGIGVSLACNWLPHNLTEVYNAIRAYIDNNDITIDGIKFYGSPWQPEFHDWAFNLPRGEELAAKWEKIPDDVDILITHGPAYGILDYAPIGGHVGCEELYRKIAEVKPKIHVCGHIHDSYGQKTMGGIEFLNASTLNDRYEYAHKPIVVEYDTETKEITYI